MTRVNHALHQSIGALAYQTSQTITAASRAGAHASDMEGYWVERALEQVAEHRRVLAEMEAALVAMKPAAAEAA